jgi:hypothetical protein
MEMFWIGAAFGGGAVALLGILSRAALHAKAERHYRAAYAATLTPDVRERLVSFEARGAETWRAFREQEQARAERASGAQ